VRLIAGTLGMAFGLVLAASVLLASSVAAAPRAAAIVDVQIKNFVYTPRVVTIDPGDSIRWTNFDSAAHGQVSVEPGFVSPNVSQDQSTIVTFDVPGTFAYICSIHGQSMQGTVVVRGTPPEKTAPPLNIGHVVQDIFAEARPDVFVGEVTRGTSPWTIGSALLGLGIVIRLAWIAKHR
jgi:plastocyanin